MYLQVFQDPLTVESNSSNAITWVVSEDTGPWKFQLHLNEIRSMTSHLKVEFQHIFWSANDVSDSLAMDEVIRVCLLFFHMI